VTLSADELALRFDYHRPSAETAAKHESARAAIRAAAEALDELIPAECREKSLALTALEESMMWANAALARRSPPG
jgi:hypothetical protein